MSQQETITVTEYTQWKNNYSIIHLILSIFIGIFHSSYIINKYLDMKKKNPDNYKDYVSNTTYLILSAQLGFNLINLILLVLAKVLGKTDYKMLLISSIVIGLFNLLCYGLVINEKNIQSFSISFMTIMLLSTIILLTLYYKDKPYEGSNLRKSPKRGFELSEQDN